MSKLDRSRSFGEIIGVTENGTCYEQDGHEFNAREEQIDAKGNVVKDAPPPKDPDPAPEPVTQPATAPDPAIANVADPTPEPAPAAKAKPAAKPAPDPATKPEATLAEDVTPGG